MSTLSRPTSAALRPPAGAAVLPLPGGGAAGAPPFRLPGGHFAAALGFWAAGALGLVAVAPELARGWFPAPRVVAVAHLFTLGWITTSIQGALYQFLPVALGTPIRSERLAYATGAAYVLGVAAFVAGLAAGAGALVVGGAAVLAAALLAFVGNLAATLWRAPERGLTWWCLAGACVYLVATVLLGASLAGNLRWGFLGGGRFLAMGVHLHVAAAGWVFLAMVGVGHRLLPMFLLSHGASGRAGQAAAVLAAAGAGLLLALHHALTPALRWTVALLLAGAAAAFVAQAAAHFRARRRPALDPGMRLAAVSIALLALTVVLGGVFTARGLAAPRVATAYGVVLVAGALSLFVAGHHYKVVPFLVWFHRFGPLAGKRPLPRVADLYAAGPANAAAALLGAGAAGLVGAILAGSVPAAVVAAALYAVGAWVLAVQMAAVFRRRPA